MAIHPKLVGHADATVNWQDAVTCSSFTPHDNSLLVVFASAADANGSGPGTMAITDSEGLTWTQQDTSAGTSTWEHSVWIFTAPVTTGTSMTVTATHTPNTDTAAISMDVVCLPGYNAVEQTFKTRVATEAAFADDFASALDSSNSVKLLHAVTHDRATGITVGSGWVTLLDETGESPHGWDSQTSYLTGTTDTGIDLANLGQDTYDAVVVALEVSAADGDPFYDDVVFLTHLNGSDAATSATDVSNSSHTISFSGNAELDTADKKFGSASLIVDGTNSLISCADSADWNFGSGPFNIEFWVKQTTHAAGNMIAQYSSGQMSWWIFDGGAGKLRFRASTDGSTVDYDTGNSPTGHTENAWNHVCVEKDEANKLRVYVNGVMVDSLTGMTGTLHDSSSVMWIGAQPGGGFDYTGWFDEIRITKGVSRYANDNGYIVPDSPFLAYAPSSGTVTDVDLALASYDITGYNIGITTATSVDLSLASYDITGYNLGVTTDINVNLGFGQYNITGYNITADVATNVNLDFAQYSITGYDLTSTTTTAVSLDLASNQIVGYDITIGSATQVNLDLASNSITGYNVTVNLSTAVNLDFASYNISGYSLGINTTEIVDLNFASYIIAGYDLGITIDDGITDVDLALGSYSIVGYNLTTVIIPDELRTIGDRIAYVLPETRVITLPALASRIAEVELGDRTGVILEENRTIILTA